MRKRRARTLLLTSALQLACVAAYAAPDGETLKIKVTTTIGYDDNVFRLAPETDTQAVLGTTSRGDTIKNVSVNALADWSIGRQRVVLDGTLFNTNFTRFDFLNYQGWDLKSALKWQLGNDFSGDLGYETSKSLTALSDLIRPVQNLQISRNTYAIANYDPFPSLRLRGSASLVELRNSTVDRLANNQDQHIYEGGVQYRTPRGSAFGVQVRRTNGEFPDRIAPAGSVVDDSFTQTDLEGTVDWQVTAKSKLVGRVGHTRREEANPQVPNFSGITARLRYDLQASSKVGFNVGVRREIEAYQDFETAYVIAQAVEVGSTWQATPKIALLIRHERKSREYVPDPIFAFLGFVIEPREDTINTTSAALSYQVMRRLAVALQVAHETRESNRAGLDFRASSAYLTLQGSF